MRFLKGQLGNSLVEVTLALAIGGIISIPLAGIVSTQLRVPLRIANQIATATQIQSSTLFLVDDASTALEFTAGTEPEYGTFTWTEYAFDPPLKITARYYWQEQKVFREQTRGSTLPPFLIIDDVRRYSDLEFTYTPPEWTYDGAARTWSYSEGKLLVTLNTTGEATAKFEESVSTGNLVGDFRPQLERPVTQPPSSQIEPLTDD